MIGGQYVTDSLRLVRQLGQGAMGSVWVADDLTLATQVAIKFMSPAYAQQSGFVERFRREAIAAAQVKSPHVAQVLSHGVTTDGIPYIVMELLEGEDLKSRIKRLGVVPPAEVVGLISQTAKALGRAHQLGIVHRDIKPDNIFLLDVDGDPFVKVLDFGVAKQQVSGDLAMTSTGSILGTPLYMSPEQLLSAKHVDHRADLWGLGVVAYHALTGQLPFKGDTLGALSVALHNGSFSPPSALRPELTPEVDVWMKRALEIDPSARFASAKEMAEALEKAVTGIARGSLSSFSDGGLARASTGGDRVSQSGPSTGSTPQFGPPPSPARQSAPAPGRTFGGMSTTGSDRGLRKAPTMLAAGLLGAFVVVGAVAAAMLWSRPNVAEVEPAPDASALPAAAARAEPSVSRAESAPPALPTTQAVPATPDEPANAAPSASAAALTATAVSPPPLPGASAALAEKPANSASRPMTTTRSGPRPASATLPYAPPPHPAAVKSQPKEPRPATPQDTIGF